MQTTVTGWGSYDIANDNGLPDFLRRMAHVKNDYGIVRLTVRLHFPQ